MKFDKTFSHKFKFAIKSFYMYMSSSTIQATSQKEWIYVKMQILSKNISSVGLELKQIYIPSFWTGIFKNFQKYRNYYFGKKTTNIFLVFLKIKHVEEGIGALIMYLDTKY